jgi:hypothetical protein
MRRPHGSALCALPRFAALLKNLAQRGGACARAAASGAGSGQGAGGWAWKVVVR